MQFPERTAPGGEKEVRKREEREEGERGERRRRGKGGWDDGMVEGRKEGREESDTTFNSNIQRFVVVLLNKYLGSLCSPGDNQLVGHLVSFSLHLFKFLHQQLVPEETARAESYW